MGKLFTTNIPLAMTSATEQIDPASLIEEWDDNVTENIKSGYLKNSWSNASFYKDFELRILISK